MVATIVTVAYSVASRTVLVTSWLSAHLDWHCHLFMKTCRFSNWVARPLLSAADSAVATVDVMPSRQSSLKSRLFEVQNASNEGAKGYKLMVHACGLRIE